MRQQNNIWGNGLTQLRRVAVVGVIFACCACGLFCVDFYRRDRLATDWPAAIIVGLVIGSILPLVVLPTCLFSVRVDEHKIAHLFCERITLKQHSLSELESVRVGYGLFAVVFRFRDGSCIHFLGAHIRIIEAMCRRIKQLRPDFQEFHFGPRFAHCPKPSTK